MRIGELPVALTLADRGEYFRSRLRNLFKDGGSWISCGSSDRSHSGRDSNA